MLELLVHQMSDMSNSDTSKFQYIGILIIPMVAIPLDQNSSNSDTSEFPVNGKFQYIGIQINPICWKFQCVRIVMPCNSGKSDMLAILISFTLNIYVHKTYNIPCNIISNS